MDLVRDIRAALAPTASKHDYGINDVMVTRQAAVAIGVAESLNASLLPSGSSWRACPRLLTVVFRSVAVPLTTTLGYLLARGLTSGRRPEPSSAALGLEPPTCSRSQGRGRHLSPFCPSSSWASYFGLAMDYEVTDISPPRKEWIRRRPCRQR